MCHSDSCEQPAQPASAIVDGFSRIPLVECADASSLDVLTRTHTAVLLHVRLGIILAKCRVQVVLISRCAYVNARAMLLLAFNRVGTTFTFVASKQQMCMTVSGSSLTLRISIENV